jgi:hypothetical protein
MYKEQRDVLAVIYSMPLSAVDVTAGYSPVHHCECESGLAIVRGHQTRFREGFGVREGVGMGLDELPRLKRGQAAGKL